MIQLTLPLTFRNNLILFKVRTGNNKHYNTGALTPQLIHGPAEEQTPATTI